MSSPTHGPQGDEPFDPYRFGHPDVPPAPEYAPPGYIPPTPVPPTPGPPGPSQYGAPPPGAQPYPPAYGPPPYQPYGYQQQTETGTPGKAIAGLVLGIASIVLFWTSFLDIIVIVLGAVFGFLGLGDARKRGQGKGLAVAGLICTAVGALLVIGIVVLVIHLAGKCGGLDNNGNPGFDRCLKRNL